MATKNQKRAIDGVIKPKKASKKTAASSKTTKTTASKRKAPFSDVSDTSSSKSTKKPLSVSVEDTAVAITINDPDDQGSPVNDVAAAIDNSVDTKISEPPIDDDSPTEEDKNKDAAAIAIATGAAVAESIPDEGLVSSAILEDDVIDKNLDDLINDIENQDSAEAEAEANADAEAEPEQTDAEIDSDELIESAQKAAEQEKAAAEKAEQERAEAEKAKQAAEDKDTDKALKAISKQDKADSQPKRSKRNKSAKAPVKSKPFRIISRILAVIATGSVAALGIRIATTGILPNKYLIPALVAAGLLMIFILFKTFRNKTRVPVLVIMDILSAIIAVVSIFGFIKINETMSFLNRNFTDDTEYSIYNVVVSKESNFNNLDDVKGKTFHSISDFVNVKNLEEAAKEQADANIAYETGITNLLDRTLDSTTYISVINSGTYESATNYDNDSTQKYSKGLKIIGELKVKVDKTHKGVSSLTDQSSVIYLSGIDTRSGAMLDRSLSDVNIVITMNPKTKEILMSTIPRDYYVQLHGTSGLPDKLTHAGALGGVQLSMDTIGDLLDINFDRYIRVNFNFVVNLVDAIGGITVYSDVDYDVTAHTDSSCVFHPGNNDVNGKCALAFARERYAYSDGDRHRGRNQEQVIEKIFNKISSSSTLIGRYSDILNSLNGSFDTNVTTSDITSLANMQLDDMAKWTINTYNLDGNSGPAYTYSYPSQQLSVMFPNLETVDTAKQKIHQVLTGTK